MELHFSKNLRIRILIDLFFIFTGILSLNATVRRVEEEFVKQFGNNPDELVEWKFVQKDLVDREVLKKHCARAHKIMLESMIDNLSIEVTTDEVDVFESVLRFNNAEYKSMKITVVRYSLEGPSRPSTSKVYYHVTGGDKSDCLHFLNHSQTEGVFELDDPSVCVPNLFRPYDRDNLDQPTGEVKLFPPPKQSAASKPDHPIYKSESFRLSDKSTVSERDQSICDRKPAHPHEMTTSESDKSTGEAKSFPLPDQPASSERDQHTYEPKSFRLPDKLIVSERDQSISAHDETVTSKSDQPTCGAHSPKKSNFEPDQPICENKLIHPTDKSDPLTVEVLSSTPTGPPPE